MTAPVFTVVLILSFRKEYTYPRFVFIKSEKEKNNQETSGWVLLSKGGDLFFLRWSRILCTSSGFVIMASTAISEPHLGQISGSTSNTFFINLAQVCLDFFSDKVSNGFSSCSFFGSSSDLAPQPNLSRLPSFVAFPLLLLE